MLTQDVGHYYVIDESEAFIFCRQSTLDLKPRVGVIRNLKQ